MNARFFLSFVLVALTTCSSQAGIIRDDIPDASYITHGGLFPATGFTDSGGSFTLIHPSVAITAAHVVDVEAENDIPVNIGFSSNFITDPGMLYGVRDIVIHPDFNAIGNGPDVALLFLSEEVTGIAPVPLFEGSLSVDEALDHVGYGALGSPNTGVSSSQDGNRRGWRSEVFRFGGAISPGSLVTDDYFSTEFRRFFGTNLEGSASPGDSGGGVYSDGSLAGVISFETNIPNFGSQTGATEIAPLVPWINGTIATNLVPEPSSALLMLLAGGLSTFYNRRR